MIAQGKTKSKKTSTRPSETVEMEEHSSHDVEEGKGKREGERGATKRKRGCLLVSTVFGTVSSLHPTSFLMIFILVKCRDGIDMPRPAHIGKACMFLNVEDLNLFRYLINV